MLVCFISLPFQLMHDTKRLGFASALSVFIIFYILFVTVLESSELNENYVNDGLKLWNTD